MPTNQDRLQRLINARHPCIWMVTEDEEYALGLARDAAFNLHRHLWVWSTIRGVREGVGSHGNAIKETEHPAAALYKFSELSGPAVFVTLDLAEHLGDARTLRAWREAMEAMERENSRLVMIDHTSEAPPVVRQLSTIFEPVMPDEAELEQIIRRTISTVSVHNPVEARLSRSDFRTILKNLRGLSRRQARQLILDCVTEDRRFGAHDLEKILAGKRRMLQADGLLEYIQTPADLEDIGGLDNLKKWLSQRQLSTAEEAESFGIDPPRGVLMLGVQGAGKSLCAKAIATAWQRPLLRLDPSTLYDRYIGESERRLRQALHQAEMMSPIVLWIDEIEKAFASASGQSNDGGLSRRMFGTLLTWMQEHREPVFLVATANDIGSLPPELMRKGRFDEIFFVDLPADEARQAIFRIHLRKRGRDPEQFDLPALSKAAEGFSGAEIEQAVVSALHEAFSRKADLTTQDIIHVTENSPPLSVTMAERVAELRRWARGRCVPAG